MTERLHSTDKVTYESLVKENPELWMPYYGVYSLSQQQKRLEGLISRLQPLHRGDAAFEEACRETQAVVEHHFDVYEGKKEVDVPGSFGFIVPTRIERKPEGENDEYATEADSLFPLLRYADISTKQIVMAGMCPFIVDRYHEGSDGRAGAIIFAPLLSDIGRDVPDQLQALVVMTQIMNDTTNFAKNRVGVDIVSFAAMLPRYTNYGQTITTPDLHTTTGHGATVELVTQSLEYARDHNLTRNGNLDRIGIVGTGAIGAAAASLLLEKRLTNDITMSDINHTRGEAVVAALLERYPKANVRFSGDNRESIKDCNATVCAAATRFDLDRPEWQGTDFEGAWIVDDSQPGAFSLHQVEARGGHVVWPIGLDITAERLGTLLNFEYGEQYELRTGPASKDELFGCEAEVLALSLSERYDSSIHSEVTAPQVLAIGGIMREVGITLAEPQCLGHYTDLSQQAAA